ncbi:membrane protein [Thalassobacillus devorans]|uniref:Membrane protein n=1 Tax=Thalassobacillus devorans TaxID=279813 RepID=A0ABQ1NUI0_9BACI|nr:tripartite tricarboxylate transporter TctB family protein [Thalassobacillus devorans]NIK28775.1 putative membrane protein [Thalassobacillus devorans]GGC83630.1 membrane protein [Thalassobacillus devorans]
MNNERVKDILVALIILGVSFLFYINTKTITPPADIFPKVVIIIFSGLGTLLLLKAIFYKKHGQEEESGEEDPEKINAKRRWISITSIIAYIFLVPLLGFFVTSAIFLTGISIYLNDEKFSIKSLVKPLAISVVIMVVLYGTFSVFLKVPIPSGMFI